MNTHRCITAGSVGFALTWALSAMAQDPTAVPAVPADWSMLELAMRELGAPGVVAAIAFWLTRSLSGWTPTIRVEHVQVSKDE